jgi:ATP adenylyltransferase
MGQSYINLWAPWRMEYIERLQKDDGGCFLCRYWSDPSSDKENYVVWRTDRSLVTLNRFPYTGGHLLIAPGRHEAGLETLDDQELLEMMTLTRDAEKMLQHAIKAEGFNVGLNIGRCAGAGLPGHVHLHVVPRWPGDTNFMSTLGNARVIPEAFDRLMERLEEACNHLGIRRQPAGK